MNGFAMKLGLVGALTTIAWVDVTAEVKPMNKDWYVVNDGVMGGLSRGEATPLNHGALRFAGELSLENNGGFASIRRSAEFLALSGSAGIRLRVKGDGRTYQFRARISQRFDGVSYKNEFSTTKGEWSEIELKWADFAATFRGRAVAGAPKLDPMAIEQIGFLIADKQEGSFELRVDRIDSLILM